MQITFINTTATAKTTPIATIKMSGNVPYLRGDHVSLHGKYYQIVERVFVGAKVADKNHLHDLNIFVTEKPGI